MDKKVIYLSGKVTGLDFDQTVAKFLQTERWLKYYGFAVINPMKRIPVGTNWTQAMLICMDDVKRSDAVLLLHDWIDSDGAALEKKCADWNKIPVFESMKALRKTFERKSPFHRCHICGENGYMSDMHIALCTDCVDELNVFSLESGVRPTAWI